MKSDDEEGQRQTCDECGYSPCVCKTTGQDDVPNPLQRSYARTHIDLVEDEDDPKIWTTPAGKRPVSLAQELEDEVEEEEEDELAAAGHLYAAKFRESLKCEEDYESFHPDLTAYFAQFDISDQQQIAMCRTYANYLAQRLRSRLPPHLKKVKRVTVRDSKK